MSIQTCSLPATARCCPHFAEVRRREAGLIGEIEGQQGAVLATAAINAAIQAHIADHRQVDISAAASPTAGLAADAEIQRVGVDAKGSLG